MGIVPIVLLEQPAIVGRSASQLQLRNNILAIELPLGRAVTHRVVQEMRRDLPQHELTRNLQLAHVRIRRQLVPLEEVILLASLVLEAIARVDPVVREVTHRVDHLVVQEVIHQADLVALQGATHQVDLLVLHEASHPADLVHLREVVVQAQEVVLQGETRRAKRKRTMKNGWGLTTFPPIFMPHTQIVLVPLLNKK